MSTPKNACFIAQNSTGIASSPAKAIAAVRSRTGRNRLMPSATPKATSSAIPTKAASAFMNHIRL